MSKLNAMLQCATPSPRRRGRMADAADRLKQARLRAGFKSVADAARATRLHPQNWADHEARRRQVKEHNAKAYAKQLNRVAPELNLSWAWLLTGQEAAARRTIRLVGYVGGGAQVHALDAQELEFIDAPAGADDGDVAFVLRGASMPPFRDGGYIVASPVSDITAVLFRLAIVDLEDGTRWFKQVVPSSVPGCHTLISLNPGTEPMRDVRIVSAAKFHVYVEPA